MMESPEAYEHKYNELYKECFGTIADCRDILDTAEENVTRLFGGKHSEVCNEMQTSDSVAIVPTLISGVANKLMIQLELLSYYHLARWHQTEMSVLEQLALLSAIKHHEQVFSQYRLIKAQLDATKSRADTKAEEAGREVFNTLMSKLFGRGSTNGDTQ